jgi:DNA-directed RNA polymerase alpha subunit
MKSNIPFAGMMLPAKVVRIIRQELCSSEPDIAEIIQKSAYDWAGIPHFGRKSLAYLQAELDKKGLALRKMGDDVPEYARDVMARMERERP